jgi:hypothetical protein
MPFCNTDFNIPVSTVLYVFLNITSKNQMLGDNFLDFKKQNVNEIHDVTGKYSLCLSYGASDKITSKLTRGALLEMLMEILAVVEKFP